MTNVFIIADLHFGHKNIINYESRPFKNIEEMDSVMIKNWNNTVKKRDKIFILGDFSFYPKEQTKNIVNMLNGYKILILGNHDRKSNLKELGFDEIIKYPIIYKDFYILSHEPVYLNKNMPYINIHGHIHSTKLENKQYFNVSVEYINYIPVSFIGIESYYDSLNNEEMNKILNNIYKAKNDITKIRKKRHEKH